ncbi:Fur family transcriptional regulator [Floccifex sp.]|uniref:Fur family transcriptional regulator n=1 Tax=Floccifex sp. TaxID=2815810 RepID=UPI0029FEF458|nr:transcriptional repressor [Floccifex sp.]MDD7282137.1 transcriptional repressor [Erysipelotrichaceae bacterium]MDY2959030.1 transcriptional repressor [Floccifex sp.]
MTKYAKMILDLINLSNCHLTAEEIYFKMKEQNSKIVLATVYNNLSSLYDQGLIHKVKVDGQPDRYDKIIRHDHLICKKCGKITDLFLTDLTSSLQNQLDVPVESYDLNISYVCEDCRHERN